MNRKKWIVLCVIAACCVLFAGSAWVLTSHYLVSQINWTMHGYLVTSDGQIREELDFSVTGRIADYQGKDQPFDKLLLAFQFPDSFRFVSDEAPKEYLSDTQFRDTCQLFVSSGTGYDKSKNQSVAMAISVDAEKEYLILNWSDEPDLYLVAAVDQAQPSRLLEHFRFFLEADHIFK